MWICTAMTCGFKGIICRLLMSCAGRFARFCLMFFWILASVSGWDTISKESYMMLRESKKVGDHKESCMVAIADLHPWWSAEPLLLCNKVYPLDAVHCLQTHQGSRVGWVDHETGHCSYIPRVRLIPGKLACSSVLQEFHDALRHLCIGFRNLSNGSPVIPNAYH